MEQQHRGGADDSIPQRAAVNHRGSEIYDAIDTIAPAEAQHREGETDNSRAAAAKWQQGGRLPARA